MGFSFYPKHEHKCPHVSHCPHLGGAALGTLVLLANGEEQSRRALHATIDAERARIERLVAENERLQRELDQVKLQSAEAGLRRNDGFGDNPCRIGHKKEARSPGRPSGMVSKNTDGIRLGHRRLCSGQMSAVPGSCDDCEFPCASRASAGGHPRRSLSSRAVSSSGGPVRRLRQVGAEAGRWRDSAQSYWSASAKHGDLPAKRDRHQLSQNPEGP